MNLGELVEIARELGPMRFREQHSLPSLLFLVPDRSPAVSPFLDAQDPAAAESSEDPLSETMSGVGPAKTFEIAPASLVVFLKKPLVTIGRKPGNDLCLVQTTISRVHATIEHDEGQAWIQDEGSSSGTTVNGMPLRRNGRVSLPEGSRIELGPDVAMRYQSADGLVAFIDLFSSTMPAAPEDLRNQPY